MKAQILFNNEAITEKFSVGWGFSCLVDKHILFDTGESQDYLVENMKAMDIDISEIKAIVISHDHWDHTGGLWGVLKKKKGLKVYACPHFSKKFKEKVRNLHGELIEADKFIEISPPEADPPSAEKNIFISGEIAGTYCGRDMPEQALVAKTKNGITVITGCAHPGIIQMVEKVKNEFPDEQLYSVFGGFHLMDKDKRLIKIVVNRFKEMKIKKAGPTHCSGKEAEGIFEEEYGDNFISVKAGQTLDI